MTGFHDGLVTIYRVENRAAPGDKPVERLVKKAVLRYARRTVGVRRHYAAMNAGARVDLLLRVPFRPEVSPQDVAVPTLDGKQYRITLVQVPEDAAGSRHWAGGPTTARGGASAAHVMDLTLERLERDYDLSGQDTGCPAGCHR